MVTLAAGGLLVLLANWLDTGSRSARDAALLVGVVAFYVVLPAAVFWLGVVMIRAVVSRRHE